MNTEFSDSESEHDTILNFPILIDDEVHFWI